MERSWLFARLAVPAGEPRAAELIGTVVAGAVAATRWADPGASWFFDRYACPAGPRLRLGFHATGPGLDEVRRRLPTDDGAAVDPYPVRDAARGGPLAHAGSDLALALLGGDAPRPAGAELSLAVAHLRHLTGLVPAADRPAFLFLHWQERGALLTGAQRRDLAARADAGAERIVLAAGDLPPAGEATLDWARYLDRVAAVAAHEQAATPTGFLLAHHAQLTHQRWGITPDVDALAALALRLSMTRDRRPATPLPTPPAPASSVVVPPATAPPVPAPSRRPQAHAPVPTT
uniref:Orf(+13) n=1 Tax=Micromonospora okii TaxID=1182970 RepID=A0A3Q9B1C9_9ACTN|nr:Orf(+13) [Micromonospora okii]